MTLDAWPTPRPTTAELPAERRWYVTAYALTRAEAIELGHDLERDLGASVVIGEELDVADLEADA